MSDKVVDTSAEEIRATLVNETLTDNLSNPNGLVYYLKVNEQLRTIKELLEPPIMEYEFQQWYEGQTPATKNRLRPLYYYTLDRVADAVLDHWQTLQLFNSEGFRTMPGPAIPEPATRSNEFGSEF